MGQDGTDGLRVLILGAGQLSRALAASETSGSMLLVPRNWSDITDNQHLLTVLGALRPQVVVNGAAYNSVAKSDQTLGQSVLVNHVAVEYLIDYCERYNVPLIHFGTNYVFNGEQRIPYTETDLPNPQTSYGKTKLSGEQAVLAAGIGYVLRTSVVWSDPAFQQRVRSHNLCKWLLQCMSEQQQVGVDNTQVLSFTFVGTLVNAVNYLVASLATQSPIRRGLYNVVDGGAGTFYDFALRLAELHEQESPFFPQPREDGVTRPPYAVLDNSLWLKTVGWKNDSWQSVLARVITSCAP